jgi:hypothetical protein
LGWTWKPYTSHENDLFATATKVTIGDGKKALFWKLAWFDGMRPKDLVPFLFAHSKMKKCMVHRALGNHFWVSKINTLDGLSFNHIAQFYKLSGKGFPMSTWTLKLKTQSLGSSPMMVASR